MLSSIGRAAIKRLVATTAAKSSSRIVLSSLTANSLGCGRAFIRSFATAGRPKGTTTTRRSTKPAATKASPKKSIKKSTKTKAKPKTKTTKSKATAKSGVKTRPRGRPQTPERKAIVERQKLKKTALFTEPKRLADSSWTLFIFEQTKNKTGSPVDVRGRMASLSQAFKELPASEQQRLANVSEQNKLSNAAAYKAWLESHDPREINEAINARRLLKKKYNFPPTQRVKTIHDDRLPKKPTSAFSLFVKARWASGDFANTRVRDSSKEIGQEWKNLPDTERHAYVELAKAGSDQYKKEVGTVLHRPTSQRPSSKP
ncbi:hypothetical protein F4677DRAFT_401093 [Hypoxylon crocopeplum]|nr:hypothetical protein F4677DRAFT_401093 [Hypoxylon crocopeplum]